MVRFLGISSLGGVKNKKRNLFRAAGPWRRYFAWRSPGLFQVLSPRQAPTYIFSFFMRCTIIEYLKFIISFKILVIWRCPDFLALAIFFARRQAPTDLLFWRRAKALQSCLTLDLYK